MAYQEILSGVWITLPYQILKETFQNILLCKGSLQKKKVWKLDPRPPTPLKCGKYKCLSKWSLGSKHILGEKNYFPLRNTKTLRQISMYSGRMSLGGYG